MNIPRAADKDWLIKRIKQVHFIGIGGVGMGGIAQVLLNLGYSVTGSDLAQNAMTEGLRESGAHIFLGHESDNVNGAGVVVVSTAIDETNPEVVSAREQRIPIIRRAEMLAEIMRFRQGVAIAGTHGKTTTTSLVASVLTEGGLDPTFVIGGRLISAASNAYLGKSEWLVAEADESDASFLHLQPVISVVTNIDADHLDTYGGDFDRYREAFVEFLHNLPFYGLAVICGDDPNIQKILPKIKRQFITYGFSEGVDLKAFNVRQQSYRTIFDLLLADGRIVKDLVLNLPGNHNVLNALSAIAIAGELGLELDDVRRALDGFAGIGRRLQAMGDIDLSQGQCTYIDDYGHHPSELAASIQAVRAAYPEKRLVVAFQPHRYSRTRDLLDDFANVLAGVDVLVLTEVHAAGEEPISGADGRALARAIRSRGRVDPVFIDDVYKLPEILNDLLSNDDLLLTLGAGSIGTVAANLKKTMEER